MKMKEKEFQKLLDWARKHNKMSQKEREAQRRSFAYGNAVIDNPNITREMIDRAADKLAEEKK